MIDWGRVSELRLEIGAEDFEEVIEIFLEEVEAEIEKLRTQPSAGELESQLHFLKGSALNLGFADFSKYCQAGETAAAQNRYDEIDISAILASYDLSKTEFLGSLADQTAA